MALRALEQLRQNIETLLRIRKEHQKTLAFATGIDKSTINKFLGGTRELQLADLDKVAEFFGIATYQLFQPGIAPLTERRLGERRRGRDRRIGHQMRELQALASNMEVARPPKSRAGHGADSPASIDVVAVKRLVAEVARRLDLLISPAEPGGQDAKARPHRPRSRARRRVAGGPDPEKS